MVRSPRLGFAMAVVLCLPLVQWVGSTPSVRAASVLLVTKTSTPTTCPNGFDHTLPCAILKANADGTGDRIEFAIPPSSAGCVSSVIHNRPAVVCTIKPASQPLPDLTASSTVIDGYAGSPGCPSGHSQPCGAFPNTHRHYVQGNNAVVTIALDGSALANVSLGANQHDDGLQVRGANDTVRGLSIYAFGQGNSDAQLAFAGGSGHDSATGDLIGLRPDGSFPQNLSTGGQGILLGNPSDGNTVGGNVINDPSVMNVISGNGYNGVDILGSKNNAVQGNLIGTDVTGANAAPNQGVGVALDNNGDLRPDDGNVIGGTKSGQGDIISGNGLEGIVVQSGLGSLIEGDDIGLGADGKSGLPNGGVGVSVDGSNRQPSEQQSLTIGGLSKRGGENIIVSNNEGGISVGGTSSNFHTTIEGNLIGLLPGGHRLGNTGPGVWLTGGAQGVEVGGGALRRNVISANTGDGVQVDNGASLNKIQGNYIGTDIGGSVSRPNGNDGVEIIAGNGSTPSHNLIGGQAAREGNYISGNTRQGIEISGDGSQPTFTTDTLMEQNWIGVSARGRLIPNRANGVYIHDGIEGDILGGTATGDGNVIRGNRGAGVLIGSSSSDTLTRTGVRGNQIYGNKGMAIDLAPRGAVSCAATAASIPAPNTHIACPHISSATTTGIRGATCRSCWVDLFAATGAAGAHGQARSYIGSVRANVNGHFYLGSPHVSAGEVITATATRGGAVSRFGDVTSELSVNVRVT